MRCSTPPSADSGSECGMSSQPWQGGDTHPRGHGSVVFYSVRPTWCPPGQTTLTIVRQSNSSALGRCVCNHSCSPESGIGQPNARYINQPDTTLIVVLSHDGRQVERTVCANQPVRGVSAAIRMLCRRGDDLKGGDTLRVLAALWFDYQNRGQQPIGSGEGWAGPAAGYFTICNSPLRATVPQAATQWGLFGLISKGWGAQKKE
jgi:hypothetical protein